MAEDILAASVGVFTNKFEKDLAGDARWVGLIRIAIEVFRLRRPVKIAGFSGPKLEQVLHWFAESTHGQMTKEKLLDLDLLYIDGVFTPPSVWYSALKPGCLVAVEQSSAKIAAREYFSIRKVVPLHDSFITIWRKD